VEYKVTEKFFPNIPGEYITAYIGTAVNIWPVENITGPKVMQCFFENGITNMTYISTRNEPIFGIYSESDIEEVASVIDRQSKNPVIDRPFGGPCLTTVNKDGKVIIRRVLVKDDNTGEIKMIFLPV
jgi:hypothetical protein